MQLFQAPLIHGLDGYYMAILLNMFTLVVGEQQQVLTLCLPCSQQQTVNLTFAGLIGRNVVGDLDALLRRCPRFSPAKAFSR